MIHKNWLVNSYKTDKQVLYTSAGDVHVRAGLYHGGLYEPRKTKTHQDIEDVTAHGIADCHIAETFLYDCQRGKSIRYAHTGGDESQSHHGVRDAQSASCKVIISLIASIS
jgi:hypothetical protein